MGGNGKLEVIKGDITKIAVDAIVNAANSTLMGGGGVDGAIHSAGGRAILYDCLKIILKQGRCAVGEAVITTAGKLPAKFVIHTVGPVWHGGTQQEAQLLANCYKNALQIAVKNGCRTIAFPCISTGIYRYPVNEAAKVAIKAVVSFMAASNDIDHVTFVCFDGDNFQHLNAELNAPDIEDVGQVGA